MKNTGIQISPWAETLPRCNSVKGMAETIVRAQEHERARIGHELHDNVNQILTCAHLYLSVLKRDCLEFDVLIDKTMDILQLGIEEIRKLSRDMVTDNLRDEGLVEGTRNLISELRGAGVFDIHFVHSEPACVERLDHCRKITLYRIIQEQIKNIIKYSRAKSIEVSLFCGDDQVRLEIKDDGVGFDPAKTENGLGLSNIYERMALYSGTVRIDTAPGKGCSVIVNMPFSSVSPH